MILKKIYRKNDFFTISRKFNKNYNNLLGRPMDSLAINSNISMNLVSNK